MKNTIQVDKGIPLPIIKRKPPGAKSKYPFLLLDIGDSFLFSSEDNQVKRCNIASLISNYKKNAKIEFKWAPTEEGIRVWRIK